MWCGSTAEKFLKVQNINVQSYLVFSIGIDDKGKGNKREHNFPDSMQEKSALATSAEKYEI